MNNPWVKKIEDYCKDKKVIKIISERTNDIFIFFDIRDLSSLSSPTLIANIEPIYVDAFPKYILEHFNQSVSYIDIVRKDPITIASIESMIKVNPMYNPVLPIVVLTQKQKSFRAAYINYSALLDFYSKQNDQNYRKL